MLAPSTSGASAADGQTTAAANTIVCESKDGQRCSVQPRRQAVSTLVKSTGTGPCLIGKTWGYDATGVWVSDNCGGEFALGQIGSRFRRRRLPDGTPSRSRLRRGESSIPARFPRRKGKAGIAFHQRLRARALHEPDAWRSDLHRSPREHAHGRWPQRHLAPPRHGLLQGLARRPEAGLRDHPLDREHDRPGRHLRQPRLSVQPEVQHVRRHQRQPGHALAAGVASRIGWARTA